MEPKAIVTDSDLVTECICIRGLTGEADAQKLGDYISQCMKNGGEVTINLGIYQDGSVDPRAVDVLKEVRQRIPKEPQ